jgi:hypothetical protein
MYDKYDDDGESFETEDQEVLTELHLKAMRVLTGIHTEDVWAVFLALKLGISQERAEKLILDLQGADANDNMLWSPFGCRIADWALTSQGLRP